MLKIGVYGLMGSGKTTALSYMASYHGFYCIRADDISREVINHNDVVKFVKTVFPGAYDFENKVVNRKALRNHIFNSKINNTKFGSIILPLIRQRILEIIDTCGAEKIIVEAANLPLLRLDFDYYINIFNSDKKTLHERLKYRDIRDILETKGILEYQKKVIDNFYNGKESFQKKQIFNIDNSSTLNSFFSQIDVVIERIYNKDKNTTGKDFFIPEKIIIDNEKTIVNYLDELQTDELNQILDEYNKK